MIWKERNDTIESSVSNDIIIYLQIVLKKKGERTKLGILGGKVFDKRKNNHSIPPASMLNKILHL